MMARSSLRKKEQIEKQRLQQQRRRRNILLGVGAVVIVLLLVLTLPSLLKDTQPKLEIIEITPAARSQTQGMSIGNPNALVKLDVYEDFQCSMCKAYSEQIE